MHKIEIISVDKFSLSSYGLKYLLEKEIKFSKVEIFYNNNKLVEKTKAFSPNIILIIDEHEGNVDIISGITEKIRCNRIESKIIVMSEKLKSNLFQELLLNQVTGFFSIKTEPSEIINMLNMVNSGKVVFSPDVTLFLLNEDKYSQFSQVEIKILKLISEEKTNKEIAKLLNYSISTIEYYIANIFSEFSVKTRVGAVREAKDFKLI